MLLISVENDVKSKLGGILMQKFNHHGDKKILRKFKQLVIHTKNKRTNKVLFL
jgi:hypothetical protein